MALRVGEVTTPSADVNARSAANSPAATNLPAATNSHSSDTTHCDAIGDGLLESMFNPNCGLDIYETCDEKTWVDCKLASSRLGFYVFAAIVVITMIIIFFVTDGVGKFVVVLTAVGLLLLARYRTSWIEATARADYRRMNKEIEGIMRSGDFTRKEAVIQLRDEKLRRETNAALASQRNTTVQTGATAGIVSAVVTGLMNRGKK